MKKELLNRARLSKVAMGVAAIFLSTALYAQERSFNIPAGDLKAALDAYSVSTGKRVTYDSGIVKGAVTKGVHGEMTPEQALAHVLEGTKLKVRSDSSGALTVYSDASVANGQATITSPDATTLDTVVVTGTAISHLAESNRTGTRTDADPMTLAMSVSTVSGDLLKQQQAMNLGDAVANVAGVSSYNGTGGYTMRGFAAGVMRNGNLVSGNVGLDAPSISMSRVEVVKGPEAIIAGMSAGYGGVVNVISKTPEDKSITEFTSTVGSRGYYDAGFDINRAVTDDKSLLVRLVASGQDAGHTFAGYNGANDVYVAPSVTWRNRNWGTEVTAQYEHQSFRSPPVATVLTDQPSLTGDLKLWPLGNDSYGTRTRSDVATLSATQMIGEWELGFKYSDDRNNRSYISPSSVLGTPYGYPFPEVLTLGEAGEANYHTRTAKLELKRDFATGPIKHKLLLAYDNVWTDVYLSQKYDSVFLTNVNTGSATDMTSSLGSMFGVGQPSSVNTQYSKEAGALAIDQLTWGRWVASLGYRHIRYAPAFSNVVGAATINKSLPMLGLVYRVSPTVSLYGSTSKGFTPNTGLSSPTGQPLQPEEAQQYEIGAKTLMFDEKIAATFSLFSIKQKNVAVMDPVYPNSACQYGVCFDTVPGVLSQGAEVEFSGQLTSHLSLRASYSYTNKRADNLDQLGLTYAKHQGSLWTTYNFTGPYGWWVGGGLQVRSARNKTSNAAAYIENPGQMQLDLSAGYSSKRCSLTAGVKNIADKRLYAVSSGAFSSGTAYQPREFFLTLDYHL